MKEIKEALRKLQSLGFTLKNGEGSRIKIIPPDRSKPFYSFHDSSPGYHCLRRFARNYWSVDITR